MIINRGQYCYKCVVKKLYVGVKEENLYKFAVINGLAHCEVFDPTMESKKKHLKQDMTIFADGALATYVESEISEGDKILILGKPFTKRRGKAGFYYQEQCLHADEIYKNEWMKYYSKGELE